MSTTNINVGELIVVPSLPTQEELNNKSITVNGVTKTFMFPVVFRTVINGKTVDYTYLNSIDEPSSSFNPEFSNIKELLINGDKIMGFKSDLIVPEGVLELGEGCFSNNKIGRLILPEGLTTINSNSCGYIGLQSVHYPSTLKVIMGNSFSGNNLKNIIFPDSLISIGGGAFYYCQIESITLGNSLTRIENSAFIHNKLTSITIPNSVTSIGVEAFYNNQLTEVTLPPNCVYNSSSFDPSVTVTGGIMTDDNGAA